MDWLGLAALALVLVGDVRVAEPPQGWILIRKVSEDTQAGAFHDSETGMLIHAEAGGTTAIRASWEVDGDNRVRKARYGIREVEVLAKTTGTDDCRDTEVRVPYPQPGGAAAFFSGLVCGKRQQERLEKLVEVLPSPFDGSPRPWRLVPERTKLNLSELAEGDSWERVSGWIEGAEEVKAGASGGFSVEFELGKSPLVLTFDKNQRLVAPIPSDSR